MYEIEVHSCSFYETHDFFHFQKRKSQQIIILQIYETGQSYPVPFSLQKENYNELLFYNVRKSRVTHGSSFPTNTKSPSIIYTSRLSLRFISSIIKIK